MSFFWQHKSLLVFPLLLIFCSVMVIRQFERNRARHVELREAFILLHSRDYQPQAQHLYQHLVVELEHLPDKLVLDDFQRTLTLVDPARPQPDNLIWKYQKTVGKELDKRSEATLRRALKMAEE